MDAFLAGLEQAKANGHDLSRSARSPRSSSPGSTPRPTSGSTRSAPRRPRRCAARRRSPTPGWPTSATSRSSAATGGGRWPRPGPIRSGRCGRPPGSRTRRTTTPCTSSSWSRRASSTRCRRRRWRRSPTTGRSAATPSRPLRRGAAGPRRPGRARHRLRRRRADARGRGRQEVRGLLERADRAGHRVAGGRRRRGHAGRRDRPAGDGPAAADREGSAR